MRPDDLTAQLGGDGFGLICARLHDRAEAIAIAERLIESLGGPVTLPASSIRSADMAILAGAPVVDLPPEDGPIDVNVQVSIGIAFGPESGTDHEHLVELADAAMDQAKRAGSGCWCLAVADPPDRTTPDLTVSRFLAAGPIRRSVPKPTRCSCPCGWTAWPPLAGRPSARATRGLRTATGRRWRP